MNTLTSVVSIGIGATVGATCRYYIGIFSMHYFDKAFPYGTLISNIIGSFIAGLLVVFVLEKLFLSEAYRLMFIVVREPANPTSNINSFLVRRIG